MFAILITALLVVILTSAVFFILGQIRKYRRLAGRHGYATLSDYLNAVPGSDTEKKEAVDLAVTGLALCIVGLAFPPLLLIGVFPLFFGARKIAYAQMGLGLVDDTDQSNA